MAASVTAGDGPDESTPDARAAGRAWGRFARQGDPAARSKCLLHKILTRTMKLHRTRTIWGLGSQVAREFGRGVVLRDRQVANPTGTPALDLTNVAALRVVPAWVFDEIRVPVLLWHSAQDNWSQPAMASCLHSSLPQCSSVQLKEAESHYGCLLKASPLICAISAER